jgi:hypothetical protein
MKLSMSLSLLVMLSMGVNVGAASREWSACLVPPQTNTKRETPSTRAWTAELVVEVEVLS